MSDVTEGPSAKYIYSECRGSTAKWNSETVKMRLQLIVFSVLIQGSSDSNGIVGNVSLSEEMENVTVLKGHTVELHCPLIKAHQGSVEWKDPDNNIMFFNSVSALKDKRYSIIKLSSSEFSISISNVTFKDGGVYTCRQYGPKVSVKKVMMTVLDFPRMMVTREGGTSSVKCRAKGNRQPPKITWKFENGSRFEVPGTIYEENKTFVTEAILKVHHETRRVTVKCLVHLPDMHAEPLMNFVKVGRQRERPILRSTFSPSTAQPQNSVPVLRTTLRSLIHGSPSVPQTTTNLNGPSLEGSSSAHNEALAVTDPKTFTVTPAPPAGPATSVHSYLNTGEDLLNSTLPDHIWMMNDTTSETANTTAGLQEEIILYNTTEKNLTDSFDSNRRTGKEKNNSSLLVLLVTCLIFALLIVVIFFAIKLRRAHIAWKRENEDSDPSEASNKSKSSQEENSQGQRRRGLFNTVFAQYVVEDPTVITSVVNPNAMTSKESGTTVQISQSKMEARSDIKETSL